MSSCLRSFEPGPVPAMRVVPELSTIEKLDEFLQIATLIFQRNCKVFNVDPYQSIGTKMPAQQEGAFGKLNDPAS